MIVEQSIVLAGKANRSKAFAPIILKEKKKILPKPSVLMHIKTLCKYGALLGEDLYLIFSPNSTQMLTACHRKVGWELHSLNMS